MANWKQNSARPNARYLDKPVIAAKGAFQAEDATDNIPTANQTAHNKADATMLPISGEI
jgi:hypothetical protein